MRVGTLAGALGMALVLAALTGAGVRAVEAEDAEFDELAEFDSGGADSAFDDEDEFGGAGGLDAAAVGADGLEGGDGVGSGDVGAGSASGARRMPPPVPPRVSAPSPSYVLEGAGVALALIFVGVMVWGRSENKGRADAWVKSALSLIHI